MPSFLKKLSHTDIQADGEPMALWLFLRERSSSNNIQSCYGVAVTAAFDETLSYSLSPLFHNHSNQDYDKEESSRRLRRRDQNGWSPHRCSTPSFDSVWLSFFRDFEIAPAVVKKYPLLSVQLHTH